MAGRTPLFHKVTRLLKEAHRQNLEDQGLSRRQVLKGGAAGIGALTLASLPSRAMAASQPKITIVGAGIAGLNAAWYLQRSGLNSTIYEASNRVGGRIWTARGVMGSQLTTEIGGEFIDSGHKEMLRLVNRFNLSLLDVESPSEQGLDKSFFFNGQHKTEQQVINAFKPVAKLIAQDQKNVEFDDYTSYNQLAFDLDHTPLKTYLTQVGASGFLKELLDVAYETEYGLESELQTALNLVFLIGTKTNNGFQEFGVSDQRYKVEGGNDQVTSAIADDLVGCPIELGHKLLAIRPHGQGYKLTFAKPGGGTEDVFTDFLLLTLPFTLLREVDIQVPLPTVLRSFIDECGYGTNSKVVVGFDQRYWRNQGYNGLYFTDLDLQSGWDSSQLQPGQKGSITVYTGGQEGLNTAQGSANHQRDLALPLLDQIFPGAQANANGKVLRFTWPTYEWTKGSYTCFKVGQYTSFSGSAQPVGNMFFAGEHTSFDFQGYMEGGAVSGKQAAKDIAVLV